MVKSICLALLDIITHYKNEKAGIKSNNVVVKKTINDLAQSMRIFESQTMSGQKMIISKKRSSKIYCVSSKNV